MAFRSIISIHGENIALVIPMLQNKGETFMLWSISCEVIMKSFSFYCIVQAPAIYPCRRAKG